MIQVNNVTKKFGSFTALNNMSCKISDGCIYGLIGSNGAGKSTFLRLITGVYKAKIAYVPDELFFLPGSSLNRMAKLYAAVFPDFSFERFQELVKLFGLSPKAPVNTFSKGMRRQGATLLALACRPKYIFFDETFDGLDPVMRNVVKQLITTDVLERQATAIITSHSLRELEDTCDQLSLLHKGGIIFESDIQDLKTTLFKLQVGFNKPFSREMFSALDILSYSARGSVATFIVRGDREKTVELIRAHSPVLLDVLPLTLEEVFIYEMEALGYCFKDMIS